MATYSSYKMIDDRIADASIPSICGSSWILSLTGVLNGLDGAPIHVIAHLVVVATGKFLLE